jgi:carbon-monoxide dehydrogenase large subunit
VASGLSSQGQGLQTTFAQIAADELGVPLDRVQVVVGDTRRIAHGIGTFASRAAVVGGAAVKRAAREVGERAIELAARTLEADPADIVLDDGKATVRGSPGSAISLGRLSELARTVRLGEGAPGLGVTTYHSPDGWTWGFGAHLAVVEADPDTCQVKVLRYVILDDCGRVINPLIVKGQILGAFAQGIGGALYEQIAYDADGQIQNASFMDFLMPYATEVPRPDVHHTETPSPRNEMGLKGVGEAGVLPVSAAIASAIEDALGIDIKRMPVTPSELHAMVNGGGR